MGPFLLPPILSPFSPHFLDTGTLFATIARTIATLTRRQIIAHLYAHGRPH